MPHPTDMKLHSFHIFGGAPEAVEKAITYFQRVGGPFAAYRAADSTTAELVKYIENTWIATKVAYCNDMYDIAKAFGVDYSAARELWLLDGRVGASHTLVYPEKRGFGGKCIPKDTFGLYRAAQAAGHESNLLRGLLEQNQAWQQQNNRQDA
jgi:UDPglucose 6-dehydrogenase